MLQSSADTTGNAQLLSIDCHVIGTITSIVEAECSLGQGIKSDTCVKSKIDSQA